MFSLGAAGAFVEDWAVAASQSVDVVGISKVRSLGMNHGRRINRRMSLGAVGPFPVVFVRMPVRLRPKRWARKVNNWWETRHLLPAARYLEAEFGPIDILHSHFYAGSGAVPSLAARMGVPFVHTEHSSRLITDPELTESSRRAMEELFGRASAVFFVSPSQIEFLSSLAITGRFELMANPVNDEIFRVGRGGFPEEIRLITVGHLVEVKRHDLILRAVAEARRHDQRIRLDIVGWGPLLPDLQALADHLGISPHVRLTGRLERQEVADLLSQADIYVHASATETFGVAIVEALFSGLPVVFTHAGGVTTRIPPSMGSKVESAEPAAIASAILQVSTRLPEVQQDLIARQARQMFSSQGIALRLREVYSDVVSGRGADPPVLQR
jgi:glycosyltransferase involved in cell wall biosynthesis